MADAATWITSLALGLLANQTGDEATRVRETELVKIAASSRDRAVRAGLAELYRIGHFGVRDPVAAYAWTLAAWNIGSGYEEHFNLALLQQYFEFYLPAADQAAALDLLATIVPAEEVPRFVPGKPFNASWWGWEDDPIPPHPGERDFKAGLLAWLAGAGYSDKEVAKLVETLPASDGRTRDERIASSVFKYFQLRGIQPEDLPHPRSKQEYAAWLASR